ncbi:MAG: LPS export ABC transporter periplasmic protein LptC [Bacteroidaceae bacterium]|nr:LPS export ABC transporter periplasmic protein LptC [Bacteroidaceae bacterium]
MRQLLSANISKKICRTTTAFMVVVVLILLSSCKESSRGTVPSFEFPDSIAIMSTYDVNTMISDSGHIRYNIEAEEWFVYSKRQPPYWAFEKGIYLEQYDTLMNVESTIKCDTAYYFNQAKLWKLIGNVNMTNPNNQRFYTDLLYWDQEEELIYSDAYIRVEQEDQITEGVGFSSNQDLSVWQIRNTKGIYTVDN